MNFDFATKISALRREKGISQKKAAEDLEISQALLSHYEKGIRECNLDFVKKISAYYSVTSDYLLGLSDTKQGFNEIFESTDLLSDNRIIRSNFFHKIKIAFSDALFIVGKQSLRNFQIFCSFFLRYTFFSSQCGNFC